MIIIIIGPRTLRVIRRVVRFIGAGVHGLQQQLVVRATGTTFETSREHAAINTQIGKEGRRMGESEEGEGREEAEPSTHGGGSADPCSCTLYSVGKGTAMTPDLILNLPVDVPLFGPHSVSPLLSTYTILVPVVLS